MKGFILILPRPVWVWAALAIALMTGPTRAAAGDAAGDLDRAKALMQKKRSGESLTADEEGFIKRVREEMQKKGKGGQKPPASDGKPVADPKMIAELVPLDELKGSYKGEDGGLYGVGRNTPPEAHLSACQEESKKIQPLDAEGKTSPDGRIVLLSLGMSNTTMEFSQFVKTANADAKKSPAVVALDGAIGGRTALAWSLDGRDMLVSSEAERLGKVMEKMGRKPNGFGDTWSTVEKRLKEHGVTAQQVQVLWIKQAEAKPEGLGEFPEHARTLEADIIDMLNIAKQRYPNLRVAYLSSRIFGGYATTTLNPEPYAYEEAFSMRWLIQDQIKGAPSLNYDSKRGEVKSPIVVWGPYLWANGKTPRKSDGLVWNEEDFVTTDHTHPSDSARQKVADLLLKFFETDPAARRWFVKGGATAAR
jgi:hypothetical protein